MYLSYRLYHGIHRDRGHQVLTEKKNASSTPKTTGRWGDWRMINQALKV